MKKKGLFLLFTAIVLAVVTSCDTAPKLVFSDYVGSWKLTSYCDNSVDVDLYIQFKPNNTFVILQRSGSPEYVQYGGVYTEDEETQTLSGKYNDGTKWICDYSYEVTENKELILTSLTENREVSVYKSANMPTVISSRSANSTSIVKPL